MPAWLRNERVEFCLAVIIGVVIGSSPVIVIPILENLLPGVRVAGRVAGVLGLHLCGADRMVVHSSSAGNWNRYLATCVRRRAETGESQIGALRSRHKCRSDCGARASPMFFPQKDLSFAFGVALGLNQYHSSQTLARCGSVRRPHQTCFARRASC